MILYLHGFNSSSESSKARVMKAWMAERGLSESFHAPDLPHRPDDAIAMLEAAILTHGRQTKLVGSSLGGFYATWLAEKHDLKAVLVNPCVLCDDKLAGLVGQTQTNWHSGEDYVFTEQHLADLVALRLPAPRKLDNYLLMVESGDVVLDYRDAVTYYAGARQIVLQGGDHGFSRWLEFLPEIVSF